MDINVNCVAAALLIVICSACEANNKAEITDSVTVGKHQLNLLSSNGTCALKYDADGKNTIINIRPKPPCYFLRRGSEKPQVFAYKDVDVTATLIVIGTPVSIENRNKWNIPKEAICGEETQGILIRKSSIIATEKVLTNLVSCRDAGADEKDFWYFAH